MIEIWKPIIGYEGLYEVSNFGRIKSIKTNKIMKYSKNKKGYCRISLYSKNAKRKKKTYFVHRLVAEVFLLNAEKLPFINHKDENKENNNVNNLEWCDAKYNNNYGTKNIRTIRNKKIQQLDKNNNIIKNWNSIKEASETLNIKSSNIVACLKGRQKTSGGFCWKYMIE